MVNEIHTSITSTVLATETIDRILFHLKYNCNIIKFIKNKLLFNFKPSQTFNFVNELY